MTQQNQRLHYLDAARGIAALMVLVGHYINWKFGDKIGIKLLSIPFNANDAVSFFFVLSGFVLAYPSLVLHKTIDVKKYYINRVFRLMPGFLIAFLLNYCYSLRHQLFDPGLFQAIIKNEGNFWQELFLLRGYNSHYLPSWTLTIELAMSFLIPFLILIIKQDKKYIKWLLIAVFLGQYVLSMFAIHFIIGIAIAALFNFINSDAFKNSFLYKFRNWILSICIVLFSLRQINNISPFGSFLIALMDFTKLDYFFFSGLASAYFIIVILRNKKAQNILNHKILQFYGKISYGIYLAHWVIVRFVYEYWDTLINYTGFGEKMQFIFLFVFFLASSTLLACAIYYWVELPFMKWGKRITSKMQSSETI